MISFSDYRRARRNQPEWWLWTSASVLVLVLLGGLLATIYRTAGELALAAESTRLAVQTNVFERNMARDLATTNRALKGVIPDHRIGGAAFSSPEPFLRRLRTLVETVDGVRFIGVSNREGSLIAFSRADFIGRDFSGRNHFQAVRAKPQRATLYVSAPFMSVDDDVVISISRMLPGPDGLFAGALVATLDTDYFADALRPLVKAPEVWFGVSQGGGLRLTNFPKMKGGDGSDQNTSRSFFRRHIESESGQPISVISGFVPSFGQQRLTALHTVGSPQLYADASMVASATHAGRWLQCCDL